MPEVSVCVCVCVDAAKKLDIASVLHFLPPLPLTKREGRKEREREGGDIKIDKNNAPMSGLVVKSMHQVVNITRVLCVCVCYM